MKKLEKIAKIIDRISVASGHLCAYLVGILIFLVLFEVVTRYLFSWTPLIADEFSRYMVIAISFLGMAYAWREGAHVRVEALVSRLPVRERTWIRLATIIIGFVFVIALMYGSTEFYERSIEQNRRSDSWMRIRMIYPEMLIVIGFFLLALQMLTSIFKIIAGNPTVESTEEGNE